jgi:hypothetical protein
MFRLALLIDGASRATLIPFAPLLFGHLLNKQLDVSADIPEESWKKVMWATSCIMTIYMAGRGIGTALGAKSHGIQRIFENSNSRAFGKTAGVILALHLLCYGASLDEFVSIYFIRFLMGLLSGLLLRVSSGSKGFDDRSLEFIVETDIAKIWLVGFGISMIFSGVLYYPLCQSKLFQVLMGGGDFHGSWVIGVAMFFAIVLLTDCVLSAACGKWITMEDLKYRHAEKEWSSPAVVKKPQDGLVKKRTRIGSNSNSNRLRLGSYEPNPRRRLDSTNSRNRKRVDSEMSNDVFFDCESHCTNASISEYDLEMGPHSPIQKKSSMDERDNLYSITKYEHGKCVFEDGSPSPVQAELCVGHVPAAWKTTHKSKAVQKWEETKQWRIENKVWKIHTMPHPLFSKIKQAYSHHIHGFSKKGYPVVYESPGTMTLKKFFSDGSITVNDMLYHYRYFLEYMSNVLCSRPELRERLDKRTGNEANCHWGFVVVMDISGLNLGILSGDVLRYLNNAGAINANHYPMSTNMALVANAPFWISGAFGSVKSFLPENTQVDILSKSEQVQQMRKYIDDDQIPKEFGGSSPYALGEHPFEKELEELVESEINNTCNEDETDEDFFVGTTMSTVTEKKQPDRVSEDVPKYLFHVDEELETSTDQDMLPILGPMDDDVNISASEERFYRNSRYTITLRNGKQWGSARFYAEEFIFVIVSVIHCLWCAAQGSLATIIPIWLLLPRSSGGLESKPRTSSFALFAAAIVVLWLLRTKLAKSIGSIPVTAPMRGYRIGVGAEAVILCLLPFIPYISGNDKMLVLTFNALFFAAMFIASIIGRMSSVRLHSIASAAYMDKISLSCDTHTALGNCLYRLSQFVEKGKFSYMIGVIGEMVGALIVTPIVIWSSNKDHHFPLDASFAFYTGSALCICLYMASFYFRVAGETMSRRIADEELHHQNSSVSCVMMRDVIAVSTQDMASMFEEPSFGQSSSTDIDDEDMKLISKKI